MKIKLNIVILKNEAEPDIVKLKVVPYSTFKQVIEDSEFDKSYQLTIMTPKVEYPQN